MWIRSDLSRTMKPAFLVSTLIVLTTVVDCSSIRTTPLDDYVNAPDNHYSYKLLTSFKTANARLHVLNMTSQKWLDERWSDRPVWWHYEIIIIPDKLSRNDTGMLFIGSGENIDRIPTTVNFDWLMPLLLDISVNTGTVVTYLKQVPNQPLVFKDDPSQESRIEDAILAWTWKTFLGNGSNPDVLVHLPMTKAAVRAMDTVNTYCAKLLKINIDKFFVAGRSKRGWTTWTTGAVDKRVIGMAPIVMDLLNMNETLHHHFRSLGGWTFAFHDYYNENLTYHLDTANFEQMTKIIDPLTYNDRYSNIPKCMMTSTGDEFFLPDDSNYFFNKMKGPTYLRIEANTGHIMINHIKTVLQSMESFYVYVMNAVPLPSLRWVRSQTARGGKITLWTDREPSSAFMYHAYTLSDGRRDFRQMQLEQRTGRRIAHPVVWFKSDVKKISAKQYEAVMDNPLLGWAAFYIQVTFDGMRNEVLEFSTEMNIIPNTFPFKQCHREGCHGHLV